MDIKSADCTRNPAWAGSFYPAEAEQLSILIKETIKTVPRLPGISRAPFGIIAPHAGYRFSAHIAASAYTYVQNAAYDTVILLGPNHKGSVFTGTSIWPNGAFATPLGAAPVDEELCGRIMALDKSIEARPEAHTQEHSLEVHIPFLQTLLPDTKLVPIAMSNYSGEVCLAAANALNRAVNESGKKVLYVASTDFSHYIPENEARKLDSMALGALCAADPNALLAMFARKQIQMCGFGPVLVTLLCALMNGISAAHILMTGYGTSAPVTKNPASVVGYGAVCVFPKDLPALRVFEEPPADSSAPDLTENDKKTLLGIARAAIRAKINGSAPPSIQEESAALKQSSGVFVTIKNAGALRGCIGSIVGKKNLAVETAESAVNAAFSDRRFKPLTAAELDQVSISVSILSHPKKAASIAGITIGVHGIIIAKGLKSALFLPEVAKESGWTVEETLSRLCAKAGIPQDAWKEHCDIYTFTTIKCENS